ncbi:hypothetical protein D3C83_37080 [compost metagenome]
MRSSAGITRSLHTIVESAMVSTITIPVAADRPPMNARSASHGWRSEIGSVSTKVSASMLSVEKCINPPSAIGSTKILMASRYSGNSQIALLRWRSSTFSTTATWNWRGRNMTASIDRKVSEAHVV